MDSLKVSNNTFDDRAGIACDLQLTSCEADAFAEIVQLLLCGEQSAVIAFERLAHSTTADIRFASDFMRMADDEQRHRALLETLAHRLPLPLAITHTRSARSFFRRIACRDRGLHLARIVALDSAVCVLVGELRRRGSPLAKDPSIMTVLARIQADEARHVVLARQYAAQLTTRDVRASTFSLTRSRLTALLFQRANALECLGFDVDRISKSLQRVTRSLVA